MFKEIMNKGRGILFNLALGWACCALHPQPASAAGVLNPAEYQHYVKNFNTMEAEAVVNSIPNAQSWDWMVDNIPLFDCPAKRFEETYYFRWWSYRKHIRKPDNGYPGNILTEFITWTGPISCSFGHQVAEGRWLHHPDLINEYALYWYRWVKTNSPQPTKAKNAQKMLNFHNYSSWGIDALYERAMVTGDTAFLVGLLDDFIADYKQWETEQMRPDGLFWQYDVRDGMEESISGGRRVKNVRPTINSYMVANARALAQIATLAKRPEIAAEYQAKSDTLRTKMIAALWDPEDKFFKVQYTTGGLCTEREELGYIPWMFNLAGPEHDEAWGQLADPAGFWAPWGLATAERRSPFFRSHGVGTCEWDGAVWPFATCQTLDGLANELRANGPYQATKWVTNWDYFNALLTYARAQELDGKPYIGEYQDEVTGAWLKGRDSERSRYYNHSTFADLVISGLVGLKPRADDTVEVVPLLPQDSWDWFCLDRVLYHGQMLTIVWDRDGKHYGKGTGLQVFCGGKLLASAPTLTRVTGTFPTNAGTK